MIVICEENTKQWLTRTLNVHTVQQVWKLNKFKKKKT